MRKSLLMASLFVSGVLVACGGVFDDETSNDETSGDESGETVGAEIASDFNSTMDKARAVEDQLQESKENRDKAVEEAEGTVKD